MSASAAISKYWSAVLRIGFNESMDQTQQTRLFAVNAFLLLTLGLTLLFVGVFAALGSYSALEGLIVIPIVLLIFYFNHRSWFTVSAFLVTYGFMILALVLALSDRRTGTEYILIAIGCCSVVVYNKAFSVLCAFIGAFACYAFYTWYDATQPFVADPTVPYILVQNSLMFLSGFAVLAQSLVFRSLINSYAVKLKQANHEIKAINEELLVFSENLDLLVKEKSNELQAYLNAINVNLYSMTMDWSGNILTVNERLTEVSGYSMDELVGRNFSILDSGYHSEGFFSELYSTVQAGSTWRGEVKNKAKNGGLFWIDMVVIPACVVRDRSSYLIIVALPITERKDLEQKNRSAAEALEDVAFRASHKIRGPLARITGLTDLIKKDAVKIGEVNYVAQKLVESSTELDDAIRELTIFVNRNQKYILNRK